MKSYRLAIALLCTAGVITGCQKPAQVPAKHESPAEVAHKIDESSLNTITLTPKAEERLDLKIAEIKETKLPRKRTFGAEVVLPPGQTAIVSMPVAGTLSAPENAEVPKPGTKLTMGQPVLRFTPLLTPERDVLPPAERVRVAQTRADVATSQIEAERQIEASKTMLKAAQIAYDRAVRLLESKAGSQRSVDEAAAQLEIARDTLETAKVRHKFLTSIRLDEEAGELGVRTLKAPITGVLRSLDAVPGEDVSPGEILFQIIQLDRVWIRVPLYVGLWDEVDRQHEAEVAQYGDRPDAKKLTAHVAPAPPSADPAGATVDLIYELENEGEQFSPGQRLAATLTLRGERASRVVPREAVLYDVHGGTWVYEKIAEHSYARRRIELKYIDGPNAVLGEGPPTGTKVVTSGVTELFGTEFGVGK